MFVHSRPLLDGIMFVGEASSQEAYLRVEHPKGRNRQREGPLTGPQGLECGITVFNSRNITNNVKVYFYKHLVSQTVAKYVRLETCTQSGSMHRGIWLRL
jgi:hypothetical protein